MFVPVSKTPKIKDPEGTRRKILLAAFEEFYRNGFQGGSLNEILAKAGTTKGALFHHFASKQELGYAVVDEVIAPLLKQRWLQPLRENADPITALQRAFEHYVNEDINAGHFVQGCPMNNLAQEMSPLDGGFKDRIDALYSEWRKVSAAALAAGIQAGTVRKDISPESAAALVVAGQMGIWGSGKSSGSAETMRLAARAINDYLESLRNPQETTSDA